MKLFAKYIIVVLAVCAGSHVHAQVADVTGENSGLLAGAMAAPPAPAGKELKITLKNDCEKDISIFAGPKQKAFSGKIQIFGGISVNTIYVNAGDVVCIMKGPKTIQACADAKATTTKLEVNKSGTGFVK